MGIDWNGLKKEYGSGGLSMRALADKYGCHKDSLRRKAKREGWTRRQASKERPAEAETGHLPDKHRGYWRGVEKRLAKGLKTKDVKQGLEELKVAKMAGEVISSMIRSKRLELGLEDATLEKGADDTEGIAAEMAQATVPCGAGETLD